MTKAYSKMSSFRRCVVTFPTGKTADEVAAVCVAGGPLAKLLEEHEAMRAFLTREMNTALDIEGYSDGYSRFKRPETAARIRELLLSFDKPAETTEE